MPTILFILGDIFVLWGMIVLGVNVWKKLPGLSYILWGLVVCAIAMTLATPLRSRQVPQMPWTTPITINQ